jgi:SsrA-binding protein
MGEPMTKKDPASRVIATNRKAFFNYQILDRVEAGICLLGTEIKSIREGGLSFSDSYVDLQDGELILVGLRIAPYSHGNIENHAENRSRKLLLHRREIKKLGIRLTERGQTMVPLKAYFRNGRVKLELGLGRGKKSHDKRESIKRRDIDRETRRALRQRD